TGGMAKARRKASKRKVAASKKKPEGAAVRLRRQLAAVRAERDENLAQQAAMAEILRAINASGGDPAPVFDLIIRKAMALCDSKSCALIALENNHVRLV